MIHSRFSVFVLCSALLLVGRANAFLLHHHHGGGGGGTLSQVSEEEFVGPFASWACVMSLASGKCGAAAAAYGTAVGDGTTDDTAAIQASINSLAAVSGYQVLWVPNGTYKISHTLSFSPTSSSAINLGIIGANPGTNCAAGQTADACFLWAGNSGSSAASFTGSIASSACVGGQSATFTNGSANIVTSFANAVGCQVTFATTGSLPTNFTPGTIYYVVTSVGTTETVSATYGGSAITAGSAGSGSQTVTGVYGLVSYLTIPGAVTGKIVAGQLLQCAGCSPTLPSPTLIWAQTTGTPGGTGTYQLAVSYDTSVTQASTAMTTIDRSMLWLNGVEFGRLDRLTFNGQSNALILVDQSCASTPGSCATTNFDAGDEYVDDVFENAGYGHYCGSLGAGCATMYDIRDMFTGLTDASIWLGNFNALQMLVWYSQFINDAVGVSNVGGAGNWRVFNSIFENSSVADVACTANSPGTMRGNYSSGSNYFWRCGGTTSSDIVTMQGNTVLDNTLLAASSSDGKISVPANGPSIYQADNGPLILIDNTIRSIVGATTPIVNSQGGLFSLGNTYNVATLGAAEAAATGYTAPYHAIDYTVGATIPTPTLPAMPPPPPNLGRTIYETSPSGSGTTCSAGSPCTVAAAITKAAALCNNAVVHILPTNYTVSSTLVVPANCAMQIVGDGGNVGIGSQLSASGAIGPVIQFTGPNKATLANVQINGASRVATGILVTNADQPGSRVYIWDSSLSTATPNILVNGLDYTRVEMENTGGVVATGIGPHLQVVGGSSANAGNWLGGVATEYAGGGSTSSPAASTVFYTASNGGHLLADSDWLEQFTTPDTALSLSGKSTVTFSGANVAVGGTGPAITLAGFQGVAALLTLGISGSNCTGTPGACLQVNLSGNGTGGQVLALGLAGWTTGYPTLFNDTTSPADTSELLNGVWACTGNGAIDKNPPCAGLGAYAMTEIPPSSPSSPFIRAMLNQMRTTAPVQRTPLPAGVTDVGIYRVFVSNALVGIDLEH